MKNNPSLRLTSMLKTNSPNCPPIMAWTLTSFRQLLHRRPKWPSTQATSTNKILISSRTKIRSSTIPFQLCVKQKLFTAATMTCQISKSKAKAAIGLSARAVSRSNAPWVCLWKTWLEMIWKALGCKWFGSNSTHFAWRWKGWGMSRCLLILIWMFVSWFWFVSRTDSNCKVV